MANFGFRSTADMACASARNGEMAEELYFGNEQSKSTPPCSAAQVCAGTLTSTWQGLRS